MGEPNQNDNRDEFHSTEIFHGASAFPGTLPVCQEFVANVLALEQTAFLGSGTSAFSFLLDRSGLPADGVILIPDFTCEKLLLPLLLQNRRFRRVDNHPDWVTPELEQYQAAWCEKTVAIVLIYIWGYVPRQLEAIVDWAKKKRLTIIEDVATAFGLSKNGVPLGSIGDYAFGSFGYDKTWELGGGGFCVGLDLTSKKRGHGTKQIPIRYNSLIKFGRRVPFFFARHLLLRSIALSTQGALTASAEIRDRIQGAIRNIRQSFVEPMMARLANTKKFAVAFDYVRGSQKPRDCLFVPNNDQGLGVRLLARYEDRNSVLQSLRRDKIWVGTDYAYPLGHWVHRGSGPQARRLANQVLSFITNGRNQTVDLCVEQLTKISDRAS